MAKELTKNQKAIARLEAIGVSGYEENGTVYVSVSETSLEISDFEIDFQAARYDEGNKKSQPIANRSSYDNKKG